MRRLRIGLFLALLMPLAVVSPAAATPSLDPVAMKRLLHEIGVGSDALVTDFKVFLLRRDRWEPVDSDRELWDSANAFRDEANRIKRTYRREPYPGMTQDVRGLLEGSRNFGNLLGPARVGRKVKLDWARLEEMHHRLADSYGWDYAAGRFDVAEPSSASPRSDQFDGDFDDDETYIGDDRSLLDDDLYGDRVAARVDSERTLSITDDQAVAGALLQLDHLIRAVDTRLDGRRRTEEMLAELARDPVDEVPANADSGVEAELAALEGAAADAQREFSITRRASNLRPEVRTLLRLAHRVDTGLSEMDSAADVQNAWRTVVEKLNILAVTYDYPTIASR